MKSEEKERNCVSAKKSRIERAKARKIERERGQRMEQASMKI